MTLQATVWTYFVMKEEGKKFIKVSSIFVKDVTGNFVEHTFSCLTDIFFRTSHWTILITIILYSKRNICGEVSIPKSVKKPETSI